MPKFSYITKLKKKKKNPKKKYKLRHNYQATSARCTLRRPESRYLGLRACCVVDEAEEDEEEEEAKRGGQWRTTTTWPRSWFTLFFLKILLRVSCSQSCSNLRGMYFKSESWGSFDSIGIACCRLLLLHRFVVLVCLLGRAAGSGIKETEDGRG